MIETDYFILPTDLYVQCCNNAEELDVSLDYFLMEFCEVESEDVFL
jgi:hypothetical protein